MTRSTPAQIERSARMDQGILQMRAENDVAGSWYALALPAEQRAVVVALTYHLLLGEPKPPSLAQAAKDCSVPSATARSWRHRSQVFGMVVDSIISRWTKPVVPPTYEPPPPSPGPDIDDLRAAVEKWERAVRYERVRERNGHPADVRRAERSLDRAEAAIARHALENS